jgi:hypothetical protein
MGEREVDPVVVMVLGLSRLGWTGMTLAGSASP